MVQVIARLAAWNPDDDVIEILFCVLILDHLILPDPNVLTDEAAFASLPRLPYPSIMEDSDLTLCRFSIVLAEDAVLSITLDLIEFKRALVSVVDKGHLHVSDRIINWAVLNDDVDEINREVFRDK